MEGRVRGFSQVTMEGEVDQYLFGTGKHYEVYQRMGAHLTEKDGQEGVCFSVWAPRAEAVSVVGGFNGWREEENPMHPLGQSGVFETFVPGAAEGELYKYCIRTREGRKLYKADPYANGGEVRPGTASRVVNLDGFLWRDGEWQEGKRFKAYAKEPMAIYEVHPGSWKKRPLSEGDPDGFYNYKQLAHAIGSYVSEMGYTHVELMGILEHPFDGSWGYQVTGYFAPTSRYGSPKDFMYFVDYLHRLGIGVILDWVPAHFPKDAHGLAEFDGNPLYEYGDPKKGEHEEWGTKVFDYGREQVRNFLLSSAVYWLKEYHLDGLRVDAVSSMLYLDYGRAPGEWVPNIKGGNHNLEAVEFFQCLSRVVKERSPGALLMAEESTSWKGVTGRPQGEGLGFDLKWNMGWMNDTLAYLEKDPIYRKYHHQNLTFGMAYAYTEQFIQALSHDEVVHGKRSLLEKMPGEEEDQFANLRAYFGFFMGHPGKKLLFMGQEFAQRREWSEKRELDWDLLNTPLHKGMREYVKTLLALYRQYPCLYELDNQKDGFGWMDPDNEEESIVSFVRYGEDKRKGLLFVVNFTPVEREKFRIPVPRKGEYRLVLDSDEERFGGRGGRRESLYRAETIPTERTEASFLYNLPGFGAAVFAFES